MSARKTSSKKLNIKQVRSQIGCIASQRLVLKGLGLGRIGREVTKIDDPCIRGMIAKVAHLVTFEEVEG